MKKISQVSSTILFSYVVYALMLNYFPNLRAKYTNGFSEKDQDESRRVNWENNEKTKLFRIIAVD